jgi:N-acetylglucosamine-6-sulfatase
MALEKRGGPPPRLRGPPPPRVLVAVAVALLALVFGAAVDCGAGGSAAAQSVPPNVLLVVTDDQAAGTVKRMPYLRDAEGWTRFASFYVNNPLCCPSRATMLTGLYSHHTGVETNDDAPRFDDSSTLATWLDAAGYETGLFGKYLNDYPWGRGSDYVPEGWDEWAAFAGEPGYYDYTLAGSGGRERFGRSAAAYSTDVLAERTADFIAGADEPFFAYYAPYAPHSPRTAAPRHRRRYAGAKVPLPPSFGRASAGAARYWHSRPRPDRGAARTAIRSAWESLLAVDEALERLVGQLEAAGELERTVIVFVSDHGYAFGAHRNPQKDCAYEECIHAPLYVRMPGQAGPREIRALVGNVDLAPTIAELAGLARTGFDGESLVPLLTGRRSSLDRPVLLRHVKYRDKPPTFWGIRTERWKYVIQANGERELYDLRADPNELRSLAGRKRHRTIEADLRSRIRSLRRG